MDYVPQEASRHQRADLAKGVVKRSPPPQNKTCLLAEGILLKHRQPNLGTNKFPAPKEKKLLFMWLANDIVQISRKKGGEFVREFGKILEPCIVHVLT